MSETSAIELPTTNTTIQDDVSIDLAVIFTEFETLPYQLGI